jgi:hypothetical protein
MTEANMWRSAANALAIRNSHPGPKALKHLVNATTGTCICRPLTVECDSYGTSKMKRQIHCKRQNIQEGPGLELVVDFHDYECYGSRTYPSAP